MGKFHLWQFLIAYFGKSNKCYKSCSKLCTSTKKFYIKDRLGLDFRIIPDNILGTTTIYNSKITSFDYKNFDIQSVRVSILDESPVEIQNIIDKIVNSNCFDGKDYCRSLW